MASHAHGNPLPGILECEYWLFPVVRCHKNTLHLRIVRNSPEADFIWSIAYFGQPPRLWFKGPEGFGRRTKEAIFVRTGNSAKRVGSLKLRQQDFRVVFLFRSISSIAGLDSMSLIK